MVVLSQLLAAEGPGAATGPYVGKPRTRGTSGRPSLRRGNPPVGFAQRPRSADHGVRALNGSGPSPARRVAQAVDALRHGWPIAVEGGARGSLVLLPVETAFAADASADCMLISAARAATLKLANQREAAVPHAPVLIHGGEPFDLAAARAIADPALDLANPPKGPFRAQPIDWETSQLGRAAG